ncbi:ferritin-like domain-containing protein [Hymenobacter sediminis]|uniref:ferritin-like domain-containing protein n=1 Tax=Hymenobacter sediminis TaxID=2218621 RepID=UPI000DA6674C|nr:ferritin-like domain-containing protein [Hymenobacter sediminis]RPD50093.1 ferritin-like domain-containing protein [Hymenobacter sediminis]
MDFLNILARLADLSPETDTQAPAPRRAALTRIGQASTALLPAVLAALPHPASARVRDNNTTLDVLKLALTLEYLESEFYTQALNQSALFSSATDRAAIETIRAHEAQHVTLLQGLLADAGAPQPAKPNFDFTGSKNGAQAASFPDVFTNLDTFLKVAQLLEDAGIRAYKGQAEFVQSDNQLLETLLRIHSTEARHASHIRTMRRQRGATVKSWLSPTDTAITSAGSVPDKAYANESNVAQYVPGPRLVPFETTLPINVGNPTLSKEALLAKVAEAFDEPIDTAAATDLVQLFTY